MTNSDELSIRDERGPWKMPGEQPVRRHRMSDTPLARIEQALAWLAELRAGATPGPWDYVTQGLIGLTSQSSEEAVEHPVAQAHRNELDGVLIVTMCHPGVLDAVEAVLREELGKSGVCHCGDDFESHTLEHNFVDMGFPPNILAVDLATALLATRPDADYTKAKAEMEAQ